MYQLVTTSKTEPSDNILERTTTNESRVAAEVKLSLIAQSRAFSPDVKGVP